METDGKEMMWGVKGEERGGESDEVHVTGGEKKKTLCLPLLSSALLSAPPLRPAAPSPSSCLTRADEEVGANEPEAVLNTTRVSKTAY